MRAKEAYSDEYNAYRTARKHGNLHKLWESNMKSVNEVSLTTGEFEAGWVHLAQEDDFGVLISRCYLSQTVMRRRNW